MNRRISDPDTLKALAQPIRQRIYRLLAQFGPATVGSLSATLGTDPGQTSYHVRELAKRGFVEEAPELARDRRERWYRVVTGTTGWSSLDFTGPEAEAIERSAKAQMVTGEFESLRHWERTRGTWPERWQNAATSSDSFLRLTPEEATEMNRELLELLVRWGEAGRDKPIGGDRQSVFVFFHSFPERAHP